MSLIQAVRLLDLQKVMEINAPGDPRLWDVLNDTLGGITVQLMSLIGLEWEQVPDRVPGIDDWTDWLSLEGNLGISVSQSVDAYCLQKRRRGFKNHPLEHLIYDWMKIQGFPLPKRLWVADHYVITGGGDTARAFESMRGLMALGSKSGIWDENTEDCRLMTPSDPLSWPYHYEAKLEGLSLNKKYFISCLNSEPNIFTSRYALSENNGRSTPSSTVTESVYDLWQSFHQPLIFEENPMALLGPEHFVVALPKSAQFEKIGADLRDFVQEGAALMDRYPGIIRYREAAATLLHLENFPDFCSSLTPIEMGSRGDKKLYALSPWSLTNPVATRRVEHFCAQHKGRDIFAPTFLPGSADWISLLLKALSSTAGWTMGELAAFELIKWNASRLASSSLLLFWSELDLSAIKNICEQCGLDVLALGSSNNSGNFNVGEQTIPVVQIPFEEVRAEFGKSNLVNASWFYKDQKSPTYGFEKAGIFPDRFLKRMTQVGVKVEIQKEISWGLSSSPVHRDHMMKYKVNQPISYIRWSEGENHWIDAVASVDGVGEFDPKALGEWACDLALRGLICRGVDPHSAISAQAWFNDPNSTDLPDPAERFGAFYLANLGLKEAFQSYGLHFSGASFSGSFSKSRPFQQELIVRLRAKIPASTTSVFPGFRMAGEILYVLGPKPAFMDAGTRLLPHFKVVSNHVSRLNLELQKELYTSIYNFVREGVVTVARPVGQSGALGAILEMSLWGNIGATIKPGVNTMELFSGAPGRVVVGVLPQEAKKFEGAIRQEMVAHVGESAGDRIFGQPMNFYRNSEGAKNVGP